MRAEAAYTLACGFAEDDLSIFAAAMDDPDAGVRAVVCQSLHSVQSCEDRVALIFVRGLSDPIAEVRQSTSSSRSPWMNPMTFTRTIDSRCVHTTLDDLSFFTVVFLATAAAPSFGHGARS